MQNAALTTTRCVTLSVALPAVPIVTTTGRRRYLLRWAGRGRGRQGQQRGRTWLGGRSQSPPGGCSALPFNSILAHTLHAAWIPSPPFSCLALPCPAQQPSPSPAACLTAPGAPPRAAWWLKTCKWCGTRGWPPAGGGGGGSGGGGAVHGEGAAAGGSAACRRAGAGAEHTACTAQHSTHSVHSMHSAAHPRSRASGWRRAWHPARPSPAASQEQTRQGAWRRCSSGSSWPAPQQRQRWHPRRRRRRQPQMASPAGCRPHVHTVVRRRIYSASCSRAQGQTCGSKPRSIMRSASSSTT